MISKEQFTDILMTLANKDAYGAASLGYLPQMVFNKWLFDNEEYAKDVIGILWGFYYENGTRTDGPSQDHLDIPIRDRHGNPIRHRLAPFGADDDSEGLFYNLSDELTVLQYRKLCSRFDEVKASITKSLMSLDLSEKSISYTDVADGFDAYLAEMLKAGGADFSLTRGMSEEIATRIILENGYDRVCHIYDPFCRCGTAGEGLKRPVFVTAESWLYPELTQIRSAFRGITVYLDSVSPVSSPTVEPDGTLRKYGLVVSDISGICSRTTSTAFQLDIHKRYQTSCPNAEYLTQDTALLTALASLDKGGHAVIITGRNARTPPLFYGMDSGALKSFLVRDTLEAVIDVDEPALTASSRRPRPSRQRRIYIFSAAKPAERKDRVLFIDGRSPKIGPSVPETVCACYHDFAGTPGVAAVVPVSDLITQRCQTMLDPSVHTAVLEEPKLADASTLLRDLRRLGDRYRALDEDIAALVETLNRKD